VFAPTDNELSLLSLAKKPVASRIKYLRVQQYDQKFESFQRRFKKIQSLKIPKF